jgi:hypothetical protein
MKKIVSVIFAIAVMFALVFVGDAISSNAAPAVGTKTVQVKKTYHHVATRSRHGAKNVANKSRRGAGWTKHKTVRGTRWTKHKTTHIYHKTKRSLQ